MPVPTRNALYFPLFVSSDPHNLLPGIFSVFLLVLYGILVTKSRCLGCHKQRKPGCIFLEGDTTPGHQLYAVIVDTGFRSPAQFTSKVTWTPNRLLVRSRRVDEPEGQRRDNEMIWLPCQSPVTSVPSNVKVMLTYPFHCPPPAYLLRRDTHLLRLDSPHPFCLHGEKRLQR